MNWCFVPAISYLLLFQSSTWLTESLSAGKYPEYKVYQQKVGKFLPKTNTQSMDGASNPKVMVNGKEEAKSTSTTPSSAAKGKAKKRR